MMNDKVLLAKEKRLVKFRYGSIMRVSALTNAALHVKSLFG